MHYIVREGKEKGKGRYWQQQPGPDPDPQPWVDGKRERPTTFTSENVEVAERIAEAWGGRVVRRFDPDEVKKKAIHAAFSMTLKSLERDFNGAEYDDLFYRLHLEMGRHSTSAVQTREAFIIKRQGDRGSPHPAPLLWLFLSIIGEAAEVIKEVEKRMKYGPSNLIYKNDEKLAYELDDLRAALELIAERFPIFSAIRTRVLNKKVKLLEQLPKDWKIRG